LEVHAASIFMLRRPRLEATLHIPMKITCILF